MTLALRLLLPCLCFVLASCATKRDPNALPAGNVYKGDYLNIRSPDTDGWQLIDSSPTGIGFARRGDSPASSFSAQVHAFALPPTATEQELVALIKKAIDADTDSRRFTVVKYDIRHTDRRSYPCVRVAIVAKDRQTKILSGTYTLFVQMQSLYCRHPKRQEMGFSVVYSHRGKSIHPNFDTEAQSFIDGVQTTGK